MDWFLYDNGLRHERVNLESKSIFFSLNVIQLCTFLETLGHLSCVEVKTLVISEAVPQRCSVKRSSWKFCKIHRKTPVPENTRPQVCNFVKKEALPQVFCCEFCKYFKNTFSYKTPPVDASVIRNILKSSKRHLFH